MASVRTISSLGSEILKRIGQLRSFGKLDLDRKAFNIVHSALDQINDTDVAIGEFCDVRESGTLNYLSLYGLFQALQTQQDAIWLLCDTISIPGNSIRTDLNDIRRMRALTVAHPVDPRPDNKEDKAARTGIVSRFHLSCEKFIFTTTFDDGRPSEIKEVDLTEVIERQEKYVVEALGRVRDEMNRRKEEHYKKFVTVKLAKVFHPSTDWMMGHVEEAIDDKTKRPIALGDLQVIEEYLERYISLLRERSKQYENHINFSVHLVFHCIRRLKRYCGPHSSSISKSDARIFSVWLRSSLPELKKYAEAIDKEYGNKGSV